MDTRTGEIYDLDELYPTREDRRAAERRIQADTEALADEMRKRADADDGNLGALDAREEVRRRFETGYAEGYVVPVSEDVARQQLAGQRVTDRRRKRKAAKAARKANR